MTQIQVPEWLATYIGENGNEAGPFTFAEVKAKPNLMETVRLADLPEEFRGIAQDERGGGLAVAVKFDGVVYRLHDGEMSTYAINEAEFILAIQRDARWEELVENMPALLPYWLGIILKTKTEDGRTLTLGFKGEIHHSAMVIRGQVKPGEMLIDALDREMADTLEIDDYAVIDLVDDGGSVEVQNGEEPLFTVTVEVPYFDSEKIIQDSMVGWVELEKKKILN